MAALVRQRLPRAHPLLVGAVEDSIKRWTFAPGVDRTLISHAILFWLDEPARIALEGHLRSGTASPARRLQFADSQHHRELITENGLLTTSTRPDAGGEGLTVEKPRRS